MPFEYVNRQGDCYYLLQGKTKTGKPKYYVSRKANGIPVENLPEGYEIYEQPERGLVSVRKVRPSRVSPEEREMLTCWTRELAGIEYFRVDVQADSLVIYTPGTDPDASVKALSILFGSLPIERESLREWTGRNATYHAMLRFTLINGEKRLYSAERWCFLGSIDKWFPLSGGQSLESLAREYLPHLNRESFFELM